MKRPRIIRHQGKTYVLDREATATLKQRRRAQAEPLNLMAQWIANEAREAIEDGSVTDEHDLSLLVQKLADEQVPDELRDAFDAYMEIEVDTYLKDLGGIETVDQAIHYAVVYALVDLVREDHEEELLRLLGTSEGGE